MPKVSDYTRTRIVVLDKQGLTAIAILRSLKNEGLSASLASVTRILKKLRITGSVANSSNVDETLHCRSLKTALLGATTSDKSQ